MPITTMRTTAEISSHCIFILFSNPFLLTERACPITACPHNRFYQNYLFTWKRVSPSLKKALIWRAAAMPALVLASAVCAPIFFGVEK